MSVNVDFRFDITYVETEEIKWMSFYIYCYKLSKVCPDKMIYGGEYYNGNGHLPNKEKRIWFEADINYRFGYRNNQRVVYSNDGLIFVTYDHYKTFFEIV